MFQNPVGDLEKVRRCRKRVKDILSDIGLESCSELSEVCLHQCRSIIAMLTLCSIEDFVI